MLLALLLLVCMLLIEWRTDFMPHNLFMTGGSCVLGADQHALHGEDDADCIQRAALLFAHVAHPHLLLVDHLDGE